MKRIVLIRHAEPRLAGEMPSAERPLSAQGRVDARGLGASLAGRTVPPVVWTSPERRARETAALAFPSVRPGVRDQLSEVTKPWYASADQHASALGRYLDGEVVPGWESREDVLTRLTRVQSAFGPMENVVLVSHGVLLTTWLDHAVGLGDPLSFWSGLRMPDAWEWDLEAKSLQRIA